MNLTVMSVLILLLSLVISGCFPEKRNGVLVAEFFNESSSFIFKPKILLPSQEDGYHINYDFKMGEDICFITGELNVEEIPSGEACIGRKGKGKLSCNNGKSMNFRWVLTSCTGGYGQSVGKGKTKFLFAFGHNKDRALDQLVKAEQGVK